MRNHKIFVILLLLLLSACKTKEPTMTLIAHIGCSSGEATADIKHSINSLKSYFEINSIKVMYSDSDSTCGYELKTVDKVKFLNGAMTDIELEKECVTFFLTKKK
jgi:hypothetical protein